MGNSGRWVFHIQQNLTAARLQVVLTEVVKPQPDVGTIAADSGLSISVLEKTVFPFMRQAGLLDSHGLAPTELGRRLHQLAAQHSPALLAEAMHHWLYIAHHLNPTKRFSWAYAQVINALWRRGEFRLDSTAIAQLVGMVVEEAHRTFGVPLEQIAFSRDSVRGVLNWLQAMDPSPILHQDRLAIFRRRYFCHPPVFLWAVDFLYQINNTAYGVRLFLTPERIDQLCQLCVLEPHGLENVLQACQRFSDGFQRGLFECGTQGGFGRWISLAVPYSAPSPLPSMGV